MKVGFIGLGRMGQAMSRRLLDGGYEVAVYNRTADKMKPLHRPWGKAGRIHWRGQQFRPSGLHHAHR